MDEHDIEIKKLKVLNNSQNQFRKTFGIEIEEYKHATLENVKDSLRRDDRGMKLDIMYNKTIENIDENF